MPHFPFYYLMRKKANTEKVCKQKDFNHKSKIQHKLKKARRALKPISQTTSPNNNLYSITRKHSML